MGRGRLVVQAAIKSERVLELLQVGAEESGFGD